MAEKPRLIVTMPLGLKKVVEQAAEAKGCSQGEVVRAALYRALKGFLDGSIDQMEESK